MIIIIMMNSEVFYILPLLSSRRPSPTIDSIVGFKNYGLLSI